LQGYFSHEHRKKSIQTADKESVQMPLLPKGTAVLLELPLWFPDLRFLL